MATSVKSLASSPKSHGTSSNLDHNHVHTNRSTPPIQQKIMQLQKTVGNRSVVQYMNNSNVIQRTLGWQTVCSTLGALMEAHGLSELYKTWWSDRTARTISEEVGGVGDTDKDNVKRRLADHPTVKTAIRPYRMLLETKSGPSSLADVDEADVDQVQLKAVYDAFQSLLFFHASVAASDVKEFGLDPNYGGTEGGITDERSLRAKKAQNLLAAKKKVFVSRKYTEVKQYANGKESDIVMLMVPEEFQNDLEVDPDSQFGVKGGDYLKGTIKEDGYPNSWGIMYLLKEIKDKEAKTNFSTLWPVLIKQGLIKP